MAEDLEEETEILEDVEEETEDVQVWDFGWLLCFVYELDFFWQTTSPKWHQLENGHHRPLQAEAEDQEDGEGSDIGDGEGSTHGETVAQDLGGEEDRMRIQW